MTDFLHASVLLAETVEGVAPRPDDETLFVDGTLGGAGHAAALLARVPRARLIGFDRDPAALSAAAPRLAPYADRVTLVHAPFSELAEHLPGPITGGLVLDLGVSSPQLDHADRGFSFMRDGPLDMRMDPTRGPTARELIQDSDEDELAALIIELGEERHGRRIARAIKAAEARTTTELAAIIARVVPIAEQRKSKIHAATRTFQALRIAVNRELDELATVLATFPALLAPGARCAIIAFHSLEDRLVKNRFRDLAWTSSLPPRLAREAGERVEPVVELVSRKAIVAADAEIAANPRARSARLRVCERTAAPDVPSGNR
jgi:16S rRNA (cytosine1402-N4)-methyltransferase